MAVPASRYRQSRRSFPESLPAIEYGPEDLVRKVQHHGWVDFKGWTWRLPKAFRGYPVAFRATDKDGLWDVFFMTHPIAQVDLRQNKDSH